MMADITMLTYVCPNDHCAAWSPIDVMNSDGTGITRLNPIASTASRAANSTIRNRRQ
jgi:hypothetical protein